MKFEGWISPTLMVLVCVAGLICCQLQPLFFFVFWQEALKMVIESSVK
jgi:hypothetical protein